VGSYAGVTTAPTDAEVHRTRRWTALILAATDLGIGFAIFESHGVLVALLVMVSYAGFSVMAWLLYLWLIDRL
jgi:hypothetical protein